jgi:hypothetical protein
VVLRRETVNVAAVADDDGSTDGADTEDVGDGGLGCFDGICEPLV